MTRKSTTTSGKDPCLPIDPFLPPSGLTLSPQILKQLELGHVTSVDSLVYGYIDSVAKRNSPWVGCIADAVEMAKALHLGYERIERSIAKLVRTENIVCIDLWRDSPDPVDRHKRKAYASWYSVLDWYHDGFPHPINLGGRDKVPKQPKRRGGSKEASNDLD